MTEVTSIVAPELDYSNKVYNHPSPLYVKITPQGGTQNPTLSLTAAGTLSEFQIPAKVVNLARSYLSFDLSFSAEAGLFTMLQGNLATTINRIVVSTIGSNTILADISNVGNYVEAVAGHSYNFTDVLDNSQGSGFLNETSLVSAQLTPVDDVSKQNAATNPMGQIYTATTGGDDSSAVYTGLKHLYQNSTVNTACYLSVRLPLKAFRFSALAIDKDMYFAGETLNIAIYWEAAQRYAFLGSTLATPSTAAAVLATVPTMSNLALYAYCEQNISITSSIIERVNKEGLTMPIPVVWSSKQNIAASTQHSITLNITKSHGNKLLFVAWAPYNNTETSCTCKAHTTFRHSIYNSYLNQVPIIANGGLNVAIAEHYTYNKDSLAGSMIQGIVSYNNNFTHFDNFTGMSLPKLSDNLTVYNGIDLSKEQQQWSLQSTLSTATALNHYIFWICQKQLVITSNSVMLV